MLTTTNKMITPSLLNARDINESTCVKTAIESAYSDNLPVDVETLRLVHEYDAEFIKQLAIAIPCYVDKDEDYLSEGFDLVGRDIYFTYEMNSDKRISSYSVDELHRGLPSVGSINNFSRVISD